MHKIIKAQWGSSTDPFYQLNNIEESSILGTPSYFSNFSNISSKRFRDNTKYSTLPTINNNILNKNSYNTNNLATDKNLSFLRDTSIQSAQKKWKKENSWLSKNNDVIGGIGNALDTLKNLIPSKTDDSTTNTVNAGLDVASDVAMQLNPLVGGIMKGMSFLGRGVNQLIGMEKPKDTFSKVLSSDMLAATPVGILNAVTATKVEGSDKDLASLANQYGGAENVEGGSVGGVSKTLGWLTGKGNKAKQLQRSVDKANLSNLKKAAIVNQSNKNLTASSNSIQDVANKNYQKLVNNSGINILASKNGSKLELTKLKNKVQKKQKGGILEGVNLIPSGALHKELNHLSDKLPSVDITRKGIPVIQVEEGGKIQNQLAEIEQSELVLHLSITKKLEELKKQYDNGNEEALLEAGKLLTDELLYNVNDNTNLLKQVS